MTPTITLPPTLPDKEQAQDQALFDANVDAYMDWLEINAPELNAFIDWVVLSRDDVIAAALAGDLPDLTGQALRILRVASSETGLEFAEAVVIPEYPGEAGKLLAVNGAETGVEYVSEGLIASFDMTGQTEAIFDVSDTSEVENFEIIVDNCTVNGLSIETSSDGVTFDSSGSDYSGRLVRSGEVDLTTTANQRIRASNIINSADPGMCGSFRVTSPQLALNTMVHGMLAGADISGNPVIETFVGWRNSAAAVQAIRVTSASGSGTFASGTIFMRGIRS